MARKILLIDDDLRLGGMLQAYLAGHGLELDHAATLEEGRKALNRSNHDALLLDLMLPDGDGLDFCRNLRGAGNTLPVLMLTAKGDELDRIIGLEIGADDYLPKPFNPRELLARLKAVLRRSNGPSSREGKVLRFGDLEIDPGSRTVRLNGEIKRMTGHQFSLLQAMAERPGRVLSREQLMDLVRGEELSAFDRSIDVHISRIRAAIEKDPRNPRRITTVRGVGYLFTRSPE